MANVVVRMIRRRASGGGVLADLEHFRILIQRKSGKVSPHPMGDFYARVSTTL